MIATIVYALCAGTSTVCAILLLRTFGHRRARLLLWAGLCFAGLAVNNVLLFIDQVIVPDIDLSLLRDLSGFIAIALLVYGLVWETR